LSASFGLEYQQQDTFRIVLHGSSPTESTLFVFKSDDSKLSASLKAGAGVSLNASVDLQVQVDDLIQKAAERLFAGVSDAAFRNTLITQFVTRVKASTDELQKYVTEAQQHINDLLQNLNKKKIAAALEFDRISQHAVLLSLTFNRQTASEGYRRALQGDMAGA